MTALPPPLDPPPPPHLTDEHLRQIAAARAGGRVIRRTIAVAAFDGWTITVFAALTLLFGFNSLSSVLIGAGMGVIAFVELRAATSLRKLDPGATRVLGFNQIVLGTLLVTYGLWQMYVAHNGPGAYAEVTASEPGLADMVAPIEDLTRTLMTAVYAGVVVIGVVAQGGMAAYYFTRRKHIDAYLAQTPEWIVRMQRAGVAV